MTIKAMNEIPPHVAYNRCKLQKIFDEFLNTGCRCAEVIFTENDYVSAKSLQGSFHVAIKKLHYPIAITIRDNHAYLIRLPSVDQEPDSMSVSKGGELKVE